MAKQKVRKRAKKAMVSARFLPRLQTGKPTKPRQNRRRIDATLATRLLVICKPAGELRAGTARSGRGVKS